MDGTQQEGQVQNQALGSQAPTQEEPVDIAEAFRLINKHDEPAAQDDMGAGEPGNQQENPAQHGGNDVGGSQSEDDGDRYGTQSPDAEVQPSSQQQTAPATPDGSANNLSGYDFRAAQQQLNKQLQQQAMREVYDVFQKNGIKNQWSIADLYDKDEQSGRVRFRNPDVNDERDPDAYFRTRKEADDWVRSMNTQIGQQFQMEVRKKYAEIYNEQTPRFQLMQFAPIYSRLDDVTKGVLEDIVEDYAIVRNNEVIGFSCDLGQALAQAQRIVSRLPKQQQAQQQPAQQAQQKQQQATEPAMDMQSSGGEGTGNNGEPRDINEAMAMLNAQRKEERKKNGK